tara:strand:+ start:21 stop:860 length:840 start_codon:yes stop_codon:yes gene_type:complete
MIKYEPENNPFKNVYCDIVHRCNMECANCYLPNRDLPDIPKILLIDFFQRVKKPTEFRFIGGEPTLHKDLPELIEVATNLGHRTTIATNGLRTSSLDYLTKLKNAGLKTVYLSMTGWDNDEIYKITDNMKCAKKKMNTLYNALKLRLRISVGTIIIKGMNEEVIDKIKDSMNTLDYKAGTSFEFRNVGQVGRYMIGKDENYSFDELKKLITSKFNQGAILENNQYSFSYKYNKYRINITNWEGVDGGFDDNTNSVRGRLTPDFKISPFLEHIKENEGGY